MRTRLATILERLETDFGTLESIISSIMENYRTDMSKADANRSIRTHSAKCVNNWSGDRAAETIARRLSRALQYDRLEKPSGLFLFTRVSHSESCTTNEICAHTHTYTHIHSIRYVRYVTAAACEATEGNMRRQIIIVVLYRCDVERASEKLTQRTNMHIFFLVNEAQ